MRVEVYLRHELLKGPIRILKLGREGEHVDELVCSRQELIVSLVRLIEFYQIQVLDLLLVDCRFIGKNHHWRMVSSTSETWAAVCDQEKIALQSREK